MPKLNQDDCEVHLRDLAASEALRSKNILDLLAERFPDCISVDEADRRPLKIGIFEEILAKVEELISPEDLKAALRKYAKGESYLNRMKVGVARIDLDGQPSSIIDEHEAEFAKLRKKHRQ